MKVILDIPSYSATEGFKSEWEHGFKILTELQKNEIRIIANKPGLLSLAKQLVALAQEDIPDGYHIHLDEYNSLEDGSLELIIQRIK